MGFKEDLIQGKHYEEFIASALRPLWGELKIVPTGQAMGFDLYNDRFKMEVKHDAKSDETGNVAIEYKCNGKPSGISTTIADFWIHIFCYNKQWYYIMATVTELKSYLKSRKFKRAKGGDNNAEMLLVPAEDLLFDFRTVVHRINI